MDQAAKFHTHLYKPAQRSGLVLPKAKEIIFFSHCHLLS
nr:MAG TPA: hypothetical protein [Caudoviricetes sp.]